MKKQKFISQAQNRRREIEHYLVEKNNWQYFSSVIYNHWKLVFLALFPKYIHGKVLDVGCGGAPYLNEIEKFSKNIVLMDIKMQEILISLRGNVQKIPITGAVFDSVLCFQVFEHIPEPLIAIKEINRVMKQDGLLFFSVPHLSRLHDLPYDFYRYTENGITYVLESGGFQVLEIIKTDGLISFLSHQLSLSFLVFCWKFKLFRPICLFINKYVFTLFGSWLDKFLGMKKYFPQGYIAIARKI